ncbi:ComEA family DNA-binding protein [Priestia megaterium]|nr:ComEA family DNA-binding protein [Priestia megaterium]
MPFSKKQWLLVGAGLFFVIGFYLYAELFSSDVKTATQLDETTNYSLETTSDKKRASAENKTEAAFVVVDIKGAIQKPGVYELAADARVKDVITKAGGITKEADINQINLATKLVDEMIIYIPVIGEKTPVVTAQPSATTNSSNSSSNPVNINTASLEELQTLNGIGPSKAQAIISYREQHGLFKKADDLREVSGIGEKSFEKIQNDITVN